MLAPVFGVARRHAQVERLTSAARLDHDRLRIHQHWPGKIADVDTPVEMRVADVDRHAHIGRHRALGHDAKQRNTRNSLH